jgi:hypothetical protein
VASIAAPILLADIGDHRFGVFSHDLKSGNERVFRIPRRDEPGAYHVSHLGETIGVSDSLSCGAGGVKFRQVAGSRYYPTRTRTCGFPSLSALNPSSPETHVECRVGKRGLLADFAILRMVESHIVTARTWVPAFD